MHKLIKYFYLLLGVALFFPIVQMALYNKLPPMYLIVGVFGALSYGLISKYYLLKEVEEQVDLLMKSIEVLSEDDIKQFLKEDKDELK